MFLTQLVDRFMPGPFTKALAGVVLIAALLACIGIWYTVKVNEAYRRGWDDALAAVAQTDAASADAASKVRITVDACFDQGGAWNVVTSSCDLPQ